MLVERSEPKKIIGFYTLYATSVTLSELPHEVAKKLPRNPEIPSILLGRLARDINYPGVGTLLLSDAITRCVRVAGEVAASFGKLEIAQALVERFNMDINSKGGTSDSSPLDRACADGQNEVAEYLLDKGAEIDVSAPERNPLFGAILGGNVAIAKLLLDRGIDASIRYSGESMHDMSAIDFARERGADKFVSLLGG